jgi:hypothetical protein
VVLRHHAPTRDVWIGQVGSEANAHLCVMTKEWKYMYVVADNRELLFRYRGVAP